MKEETVKTDILCIGGGPAGLMAAIRAGELDASVVVADKSNTLCSGSAGAGNDHYACYIPEVHGQDSKPILEEYLHHPQTGIRPEFAKTWLERSFEIVKLWDSWGIPMKYKGRWEFAGHAFPGRPPFHLKYSGGNQKQVLTRQALKRGAVIMNRVNVFELLRDEDRVVGALGLDTWNDRIIEFQAKAVFLGTGACARLYPSTIPAWLCNTQNSPFSTGDGRAMVYRAGGELRDMEFIGQHAGIKNYLRSGKATWIGVLRGPDDKPIGPFITKPDRIYGDATSDIWTSVFSDYMKSGKGPVFMDCRGASMDDIDYMKHWLLNEGNKGILDHMDEEGIDLLKHAIEFCTYGVTVKGGVAFNINGETSLKGLFAAGQEWVGDMSFSTIWGQIAGETAAKYVKGAEHGNTGRARDRVTEKMALLESMLNRNEGATWKEANIAIQQIMSEYAGTIRSETLLEQGLRNLRRLKKKVTETLVARNGHELGRCLEVLNLLDVGEASILCAQERKETRAKHNRTDYPFTNPLLNKVLVIRKENGKAVFDFRAK